MLTRVRLPHILALALALRLVALAIPAVVHPDEIFQYLEPAHRLLFGTGIVTWEWRDGIRGWLLPLLIAGPMAAGATLAPASGLYLLLPKLLMTLASLGIVATAWVLGARLSRLHAVFAALVAACWYETVFFAPHVMTETAAVVLILPAAYLLIDHARATTLRLAVAGVALGLAASLRFQYIPAIGTLALLSLWRRPRALLPVVIGGLAGLVPEALADLAMGAAPYHWLVENIRLNLFADRAAQYGVSGPFGLVIQMWPRWSLWGIPLLLLAVLGARRYPALGWTAAVNFAFHSAIAHKEYRFVLLSAVLAVILAAIGTIDLTRWIARRQGAARARERLRFFALCWAAASLSLAFGAFRPLWHGLGPQLHAFAMLRDDPKLCGIAIYRQDFSRTTGYSTLHRAVPMLWFADEAPGDPRADLARNAAAANTVLIDRARSTELPAGYAQLWCRHGLCLYRRPGGCDPAVGADYGINRVLARIDA